MTFYKPTGGDNPIYGRVGLDRIPFAVYRTWHGREYPAFRLYAGQFNDPQFNQTHSREWGRVPQAPSSTKGKQIT
jgi:hypothetical protein